MRCQEWPGGLAAAQGGVMGIGKASGVGSGGVGAAAMRGGSWGVEVVVRVHWEGGGGHVGSSGLSWGRRGRTCVKERLHD